MRRTCNLGLLAFLAAFGVQEAAAACDPVDTFEADSLPELWRSELEALVTASSNADMPWGCSGGTVTLALAEDDQATLEVSRAGYATVSRSLASPEEVVPIGKALLAQAMPVAAPLKPGVLVIDEPIDAGVEPEEPPIDPRALVEATGGLRYAGVTGTVLVAGGARGGLPFGPFQGSIWVRYSVLAGETGAQTPDLGMSELLIGGGFGYSIIEDPVDFRVGLFGAMAVIDMESTSTAVNRELDVESGAVDGRVGAELRVAIPIYSILSAMIAIDGDFAPASLGDTQRRLAVELPPLPAYTIGLSTGLEVGIP